MNTLECLSEDTLMAVLDGKLGPAEQRLVDEHLSSCEACLRLVAVSSEDRSAETEGTPPAEERIPDATERGQHISRYRVTGPIGAGGAGVVYSAWDPELGRPVALKLLHTETRAGSDGRSRVLREAQAMARLTHPNVVAIYDVGTWREQVFIAMELVEGGTLREWQTSAPRSWREILQVYLAAGRGLAAAHAAGLVHRDFKPDNVLIAPDGRVLVTDFGLAREARVGPEPREQGDLTPASSSPSISTLTPIGSLIGTPAYMSPEQLDGARVSAASDLFSFCVALYEALCGARPFEGRTVFALRAAIGKGQVRAPPRARHVPAWLHRLVVSGLCEDPAARPASMDALLEALHGAQTSRRRWLLVTLAGAVTLLVVASFWLARPDPKLACRESAQRFADLWDAPRRSQIEGAFKATNLAYAGDAFQRVATAFDRFRAAWTTSYMVNCERSIDKQPDDASAYLRMACLAEQRAAVQAKSDLFAQADAKLVEVASAIASGIEDPADCATTAARSAPPPPEQWQRRVVEQVRERLVRARSLTEAGRFADALALASGALADVDKVGWPPLRAEALLVQAETQNALDEVNRALETATEAAFAAEACRHDFVAARAWLLAAHICSQPLNCTDRAPELIRLASAAVARIGGDPVLSAHLENSRGNLLRRESKFKEAEEAQRRALGLYEGAGRRDQFYTWLLNDEAIALYVLGRGEESLQVFQRAAEMKERLLGPNHPDLGATLDNLGSALTTLGRYDEAQRVLDRATAILSATLKPDHFWIVALDTNLGDLAYAKHDYPSALAWYRRAVQLTEERERGGHPFAIEAEIGVGRTLLALGHPQDAIATVEQLLGGGHSVELLDLAAAQFVLARARLAAGRDRGAALRLARKARDNFVLSGQTGTGSLAELDTWLQAQH